jgi:hypothetical protein
MEGAKLMGELFIQKANGQTITFHRDGTVTKGVQPLQMDFCDKCQQWQPLDDGRYQEIDGLKIMWFCQGCK